MQRAFDVPEHWNSPKDLSVDAVDGQREETEHWPRPEELFREAGIVLAAALGAGFLVQLLLPALGIPAS